MNLILQNQLSIRKLTVFILTIVPLIYSYFLFYKIVEFREIEISEYYQLILIFFLFTTLSYGAAISIVGFFVSLLRIFKKSNSSEITISSHDPELLNIPVAIVMPIFEEEIQPTFNRIRVMFESIENKYKNSKVDFFILSDTRTPEKWLQEEIAFNDLCEQISNYNRIFYRRRKLNLNKKSGNISDFCRRWGQLYKYMIILDADSLMTADCIFQMISSMESNPKLGILQSPPRIINGKTIFQKITQFTSNLFNPILLSGSEFWQQNSGSYWGHNAIIRMKAFIEFCALPKLPSYGALGGRILSHDTVESALMRKAGYEVRVNSNLIGSYEESPPSILESLKRDNRWCQGNLQHLWFLFVRIPIINKIHILFGIFAYFNSLLWGIFIVLSVLSFWDDFRFFSLSMLPEEFKIFTEIIYFPIHLNLLILTFSLLFLPRILSYLNIILDRNRARAMGGIFWISISLVFETIYSILTAPIYLVFHSIFVIFTILNKKIEWDPQNRYFMNKSKLKSSFRTLSGLSLLGLALSIFLHDFSPIIFASTLPIWLGWILSFPISYFTSLSYPSSHSAFKRLFRTEEDMNPCAEIQEYLILQNNDNTLDIKLDAISGKSGIFTVLVDPFYFDLHLNMQGEKKSHPLLSTKINRSFEDLLIKGPSEVSQKDLILILSNRDALTYLHQRIWKSDMSDLALFWRIHWRDFRI